MLTDYHKVTHKNVKWTQNHNNDRLTKSDQKETRSEKSHMMPKHVHKTFSDC